LETTFCRLKFQKRNLWSDILKNALDRHIDAQCVGLDPYRIGK